MDFEKRPLGVIPSKQDVRDYRITQFIDLEEQFPESYLVEPYKSEDEIPVYDQNGYGMCVAFSGASIKEQQEYLETGKPVRMSPGFIYGNREDGMYMGEGMEPREAWAMLCKDGVPTFDEFPILGDFPTCYGEVLKNKAMLKEKAMQNKTLSYVRLYTVEEIKTALMKMGAVNLDIAVYKSFYECPKNGKLGIPTGSIYGYHALTIVGWTKDNEWIVLNSWGKEWGKNGLCYMPFNYKGIMEVWAITDLQKKTYTGDVENQVLPPGYFMLHFRALFESLGAEVRWWRDENKKINVEAIVPAYDKKRKITTKEGSKEVIVEVVD